MNIQEALSTLRNYRERCAVGLVVMGESAESDEMCQTVGRCYPVIVEAWLAEHDETPVDEAWLRSVGFVDDMGDWRIEHYSAECVFVTALIKTRNRGWAIGGGSRTHQTQVPIIEPKTRGDVRRLCAALGVKLTEGTV